MRSGMNQLHVVNVLFDDRFGGPHKRVIEVASRLALRGISTTLCLPAGTGNGEDVAHRQGIKVKRLAFARIPKQTYFARLLWWMIRLPYDVWLFVRFLRAQRADVVHVNGAFFITPAIAAGVCRVPLVWHLNDTMVEGPAKRLLISLVRRLATRIVVAAGAVATHYGLHDVDHMVIYAPVDVQKFRPIPRSDKRGNPRILIIANWSPVKGIEYFVEALGQVHKTHPNVTVTFAGAEVKNHSNYALRLMDRIRELGLDAVVERLGFVDDIPRLLSAADLLVLSSVSEACPMSVLEAMAAAVPVVATDVGGVRELILPDSDSPAGLLIAPRDSIAMASAITTMLSDPRRAQVYGENGRRIAEQLFSLAVCCDSHESLYRAISRRI